MKGKTVYSSSTVSKLLDIPYTEEPNALEIMETVHNGIFIGNSGKMNLPVFLDFASLFNPHVFIVGMTGSGKTFLMKSLLMRLSFIMGANVIIVDFTGEYREAASLIGADFHNGADKSGSAGLSRSSYFMLKNLKENEKVACASEILKSVATKMRGNIGRKDNTFILLDESWKLMDNNEDLEIIVREGRKYGVGLLLASQLLEDMSDGIVSNSASIFIFRIQVKKSAEKIISNYNLGQEYVENIQGLDQGKCLLIKLDKNNKRSITIIRKVSGISINPKTRLLL